MIFKDKIKSEFPSELIHIGDIAIRSGIYKFINKSNTPACLVLTNNKSRVPFEFNSNTNGEVIKLTSGTYAASIFLGANQFELNNELVKLHKLNFIEVGRLYFSKLLQALKSQTNLKTIIKKIIHSQNNNSFGISAINNIENIGPITKSSLKNSNFIMEQDKLKLFQETLKNKYNLETVNFEINEIIDFNLDNLYSFIENNSQSEIIIFDAIYNNLPFFIPRFDPIFFSQYGLFMPYLKKIGTNINWENKWKNIDAKFAKYNSYLSVLNSIPANEFVNNNNNLSISIIIPTRDRSDLLEKCLERLYANAKLNFETIIIDNGSIENETFELFAKYSAIGAKIIKADIEFNFSRLCNIGAENAEGEVLVFLNNDVEITDPFWLNKIIALTINNNIGAVGTNLYYENLQLQHGGVFIGKTIGCGHYYNGIPKTEINKVPSLNYNSSRLAVTAALLAIEKKKFIEAGKFDETNFPITFNDIDLCLKLKSLGYYNGICALTDAIHKESQSRNYDYSDSEITRRNFEVENLWSKWSEMSLVDEYLPNNLSLNKSGLYYK